MICRKFILWHPDSPGGKVLVTRWFWPRSPFARSGEVLLSYRKPIDLTKRRNP